MWEYGCESHKEQKNKINDEILDVIGIKRQMLTSLSDRIQKCDRKMIEVNSVYFSRSSRQVVEKCDIRIK